MDLTSKHKTIKFLEDNIGEKLNDLCMIKSFNVQQQNYKTISRELEEEAGKYGIDNRGFFHRS